MERHILYVGMLLVLRASYTRQRRWHIWYFCCIHWTLRSRWWLLEWFPRRQRAKNGMSATPRGHIPRRVNPRRISPRRTVRPRMPPWITREKNGMSATPSSLNPRGSPPPPVRPPRMVCSPRVASSLPLAGNETRTRCTATASLPGRGAHRRQRRHHKRRTIRGGGITGE